MGRFDWLARIQQLDPETDFLEIYRITATHEFPWDVNQSLSFALFRTYAVPSIGRLLARTGEFTERVQKRYDDTGLLLDAVLEHGYASSEGRTAIRRMNQMHGCYTISNTDMRYVLSTFVTVPIRWIDELGWRRLSEQEKIASAHYYRELGRRMGITDIPATYHEFATYFDDYEAEHFAFDAGARAVADSTPGAVHHVPAQPPRARCAGQAFLLRPDGRPAARRVRLSADLGVRAGGGSAGGVAAWSGGAVPAAARGAEVLPPAAQLPQLPRRLRSERAGHVPAGRAGPVR